MSPGTPMSVMSPQSNVSMVSSPGSVHPEIPPTNSQVTSSTISTQQQVPSKVDENNASTRQLASQTKWNGTNSGQFAQPMQQQQQLANFQQNFYQNGPLTSPDYAYYPNQQQVNPQTHPLQTRNWNNNNNNYPGIF